MPWSHSSLSRYCEHDSICWRIRKYNSDSIKCELWTGWLVLPVDDLGGAVDVAAADPGRRHGEDADKHADVPPGEHDFLLRERSKRLRAALLLFIDSGNFFNGCFRLRCTVSNFICVSHGPHWMYRMQHSSRERGLVRSTLPRKGDIGLISGKLS